MPQPSIDSVDVHSPLPKGTAEPTPFGPRSDPHRSHVARRTLNAS
ncbi:hypothetical protein GCM10009678_03600 [Actinomadura kijaniata]|uniref:Uncharacterized protein n=1 Tax=Actinomadura namibiensis TaxID=182080 RepID=A0A7W3LTL2_ACTNM|nr:hypothetical protein [Actinomadura namibiensis]